MTQPVNMRDLNETMLRSYQRELHQAIKDPRRLEKVYGSFFLRSDRTSQLDAICRTAAQVTASHASEINLLTENHQITIAQYGAQTKTTPIVDSYCQHQLMEENRPMQINNSMDSYLLCSINTTTTDGIRAYLGVPLLTSGGYMIGTLCVYDMKPRDWRAQDVSLLSTLAAQIMELEEAGAG